jgi:hypothetical protein
VDGGHHWGKDAGYVVYASSDIGSDVLGYDRGDGRGKSLGRVVHPRGRGLTLPSFPFRRNLSVTCTDPLTSLDLKSLISQDDNRGYSTLNKSLFDLYSIDGS